MVDTPNPIDRPLTEEERHAVDWLLRNGAPEARTFLSQLNGATVSGVCGCGCASIDFVISGQQPITAGMNILSDYYWVDSLGHTGGIFVFSVSGQLAGLEVYSMDGLADVSHLPELNSLVPLEASEHNG